MVRPMFGPTGFIGGAPTGGRAAARVAVAPTTSRMGGPPPIPVPLSPRANRPRRIGEMLGFGDNPLYQLFDANRGSLQAMALGIGEDPRTMALLAAQGRAQDDASWETREEEQRRLEYAELLRGWGEEYEPYAAGIEQGAFDAGEGYGEALKYRSSLEKEAKDRDLLAQNSQFLPEGPWRNAYMGGAVTFDQANEWAQGGGASDMTDTQTNLSWRAQEAGLQPGTQEYQTFMLTGGASVGGAEGVGRGSTIYTGRDAEGNIVPMQAGEDGNFYPTNMPEGIDFDPGALNAERAAGGIYGKGAGQAALDIPAATADVTRITTQIEDLKKHPGLDQIFGGAFGTPFPNQWLPTVPGTPKADAGARIDQMSGNAFLSGRSLLKGGGAITDFESQKAEAAFARLSTAQSKPEFLLALDEFQQAVEQGLAKIQAQAGGTGFSSDFLPQGGTDYKSKYGLQ